MKRCSWVEPILVAQVKVEPVGDDPLGPGEGDPEDLSDFRLRYAFPVKLPGAADGKLREFLPLQETDRVPTKRIVREAVLLPKFL
jgi:hypothetical protein